MGREVMRAKRAQAKPDPDSKLPGDATTLEDCTAALRELKTRIGENGWSEILRWYVDQWLDKQNDLRQRIPTSK